MSYKIQIQVGELSMTITWLPIKLCHTMFAMAFIIPNTVTPHFSNRYACTNLHNFIVDSSNLLVICGILILSYMSKGNFCLLWRKFGIALEGGEKLHYNCHISNGLYIMLHLTTTHHVTHICKHHFWLTYLHTS